MNIKNILTEVEDARALFSEGKTYASLKEEIKAKIVEDLKVRKTELIQETKAIDDELVEKTNAINEKYAKFSVEERAEKTRLKEYKDEISGVKTVHQRAMRKLSNDYDKDVVTIKSQEAILLQANNQLLAEAKGKKSDGLGLGVAMLNAKASFNLRKMLSNRKMWTDLVPLFVLIVLFVAYFIACKVNNYELNIDTVLTNGIYVAIVAIGAVFIYSQGAFDMSLGNACLVAAGAGIMTYIGTGNIFLTFVICLSIGVGLGVLNAVLANYLNMPVMVMTLTMQNVLVEVYSTMSQESGGYIQVDSSSPLRGFGGMELKWAILILFIVFAVILFNYTKIGRRDKMIGANATSAKFTGINLVKAGIISFAISGIGLGLCGFIYITQMGSVNSSTLLNSVGLNVIIAINLGGMPTSGGPKSSISAALVGGFFCTILDQLFTAMNLITLSYLAKGVVFLIAVALTSIGNRPKRLA